jgi:hypothetical protein
MRKLILACIFSLSVLIAHAAERYWSSGFGDLLFQFSDIQNKEGSLDSKMRFTGWFHLSQNNHIDFGSRAGIFYGAAMRNVGLIYTVRHDNDEHKYKKRVYTVGMPVAFKIGNMTNFSYFYFGGEIETPLHFKQKHFRNGKKVSKEDEWFSSRTYAFMPSMMFGRQFSGGWNLCFKWYLRDFFNKDYKGEDFYQPADYSNFIKSKIFYLSVSVQVKNKALANIGENKNEKFAGL